MGPDAAQREDGPQGGSGESRACYAAGGGGDEGRSRGWRGVAKEWGGHQGGEWHRISSGLGWRGATALAARTLRPAPAPAAALPAAPSPPFALRWHPPTAAPPTCHGHSSLSAVARHIHKLHRPQRVLLGRHLRLHADGRPGGGRRGARGAAHDGWREVSWGAALSTKRHSVGQQARDAADAPPRAAPPPPLPRAPAPLNLPLPAPPCSAPHNERPARAGPSVVLAGGGRRKQGVLSGRPILGSQHHAGAANAAKRDVGGHPAAAKGGSTRWEWPWAVGTGAWHAQGELSGALTCSARRRAKHAAVPACAARLPTNTPKRSASGSPHSGNSSPCAKLPSGFSRPMYPSWLDSLKEVCSGEEGLLRFCSRQGAVGGGREVARTSERVPPRLATLCQGNGTTPRFAFQY